MQPTFSRPDARYMERLSRVIKPWETLTSPVFLGMERVPFEGPLLFVGNHTIYGVLDAPLLFMELYRRHGIFLRSLGDHLHFKIPLWRDFLQLHGAVDGTPEHCAALMEARERILVFPGGAREVAKRRGEEYRLVWGERTGFARMAIAHACTIVPFAAVGAEDMYEIVLDADDLLATPLARVIDRLGIRRGAIPPLARGLGPTLLPRPERFYFHIGEPIEVTPYGRDPQDRDQVGALRDRTRAAVEEGIETLLEHRRRDPERHLIPRLLGR